jgi:hypothetical protein
MQEAYTCTQLVNGFCSQWSVFNVSLASSTPISASATQLTASDFAGSFSLGLSLAILPVAVAYSVSVTKKLFYSMSE